MHFVFSFHLLLFLLLPVLARKKQNTRNVKFLSLLNLVVVVVVVVFLSIIVNCFLLEVLRTNFIQIYFQFYFYFSTSFEISFTVLLFFFSQAKVSCCLKKKCVYIYRFIYVCKKFDYFRFRVFFLCFLCFLFFNYI